MTSLVGPVVKNPPSNARDAGLIPGQGTKIPHAAGQLSPCATTAEFARLNQSLHAANYTLWNLRTTTTEAMCPGAWAPQLERENPHAATREKPAHHNEEPACLSKDPPCAATKTRGSQK